MAEIEYYYAAYSAYAHLGHRRLLEIAAAGGHTVRHVPFDLRVVLDAIGAPNFRTRTRPHVQYFFGRDMERWAELRGVEMMARRPTHHDNDITLPNCTLIAAMHQGHDVGRLAGRMLEAHWRDDADLASPDDLAAIARDVGLDPAPLLAGAGAPEVLAEYRANTDEAIRRNVFGSPAYFACGDMFYGQDHLEMLERALAKPFAGRTWAERLGTL